MSCLLRVFARDVLMSLRNRTHLVEQAQKISPNFALYLPRTSDLNQIAKIMPSPKVQAIHYCVRQRSKVRDIL